MFGLEGGSYSVNLIFTPNFLKLFESLPYVSKYKDFIKNSKINLNNVAKDFDGQSSNFLEGKVRAVNIIQDDQFTEKLKKFLQSKTDVPLEIKVRFSKTYETFFIEIYPIFTLNDFLSCRYKKWDFPHRIDNFDEKIGQKFLFSSYFPYDKMPKGENAIPNVSIKLDVVWPREIGTYVVEKNSSFRDKIPEDLKEKYGFQIEYGLCDKNPKIYVGVQFDHQYDRKEREKITKIKNSLFPNSELVFLNSDYWFTRASYDPTDKRYWTKEKLFKYFEDLSNQTYGDIYEYDFQKFTSLDETTQVFCKKHQHSFDVLPLEHLKGKRCPFDNESKGEKLVRVFLQKKGVEFTMYHRIKDCFSELNGRCYTLPFDFYLPKTNILIEYDGEQHYKPVEIWGGEKGYENQKRLDAIKNRFAADNNITLIRIPFTVKKESQLNDYLPDNLLGFTS
jgi:hypothetical protein